MRVQDGLSEVLGYYFETASGIAEVSALASCSRHWRDRYLHYRVKEQYETLLIWTWQRRSPRSSATLRRWSLKTLGEVMKSGCIEVAVIDKAARPRREEICDTPAIALFESVARPLLQKAHYIRAAVGDDWFKAPKFLLCLQLDGKIVRTREHTALRITSVWLSEHRGTPRRPCFCVASCEVYLSEHDAKHESRLVVGESLAQLDGSQRAQELWWRQSQKLHTPWVVLVDREWGVELPRVLVTPINERIDAWFDKNVGPGVLWRRSRTRNLF